MARLVFDFDGTIADSFGYFVNFLADEAGQPHPTGERLERLKGASLPWVAHRTGHSWVGVPGLFFKGRRQMTKSIEKLSLFPGIKDTVQKLHAQGHELMIVSSNSAHNIQKFLKKHAMSEYFTHIYDNVVIRKGPTLKKIVRANGTNKDNVWLIGDELRDIRGAHAAGIRCIAVSWGFAFKKDLAAKKPYVVIDKPEEILQIVGAA